MHEQKCEEMCLVDEDEREEEEKMRTREKRAGWETNPVLKQFLKPCRLIGRSCPPDQSGSIKRRENSGSRVLKTCLICDSVLKELSFNI